MIRKLAVCLIFSLLVTSAFAETTTPPATITPPVQSGHGANFEAHKQKMLTNIDQRIAKRQAEGNAQRVQKLQALQACVQSAQDHAAIKACQAMHK